MFPNNLGDTCVFAIIPKLIKELYPKDTLEVVTDRSFLTLLECSRHVDAVREPNQSEITTRVYPTAALTNKINNGPLVIFPINHPKLFQTIKANFEKFVESDSVNFILLNYLLQLGLVEEFINHKDFYLFETKKHYEKDNDDFNVAVCPMLKLNGKPNPHPGCNGEGFRFNGNEGLRSWKELVSLVKNDTSADIYEFSNTYLGLGDYHIGHRESMLDLYLDSLNIDYAITTDGGYHHLFNLSRTPITLFTGTKVTKPEFMQLGNAYVPDVHLECRKTCSSFYSEVFGVEDKSLTCNLECEQVDVKKLSALCLEDLNHVRSNRIRKR